MLLNSELFYFKINVCYAFPVKPLTLRMDHAKLFDVLTSLPVSHAVLPRAVCFATSRPANHAICSFTNTSGYASGPIRIFFIYRLYNIFSQILTVQANDFKTTRTLKAARLMPLW